MEFVLPSASPPVWAFGFATPWLLWGLALGGIPLLIHLLHRRRFQMQDWAAMRFLLAAIKKNSRRMRLEQLIVLLIRTLIILLTVLALAQPQLQNLGRFFAADAPTHRILVLDSSFSLGYSDGTTTRFQKAKGIAQQIIEGAHTGDAFHLVRLAGSEPRVVIRQPSFQPHEVLNELQALTLPDEFGEVLQTIQEVSKLAQSLPEIPQKEVYILTDCQRSNWLPESAQGVSELRTLLRELGDRTRLVLIDVGEPGDSNRVVSGFEAQESFIAIQQPVRFKVAATSFGAPPSMPVPLEFFVDGRLQEVRPFKLQPGVEAVEFFTYTFPAGGEHRLRVQLARDNLPVDDQRQLVVQVKDQVRILCVNGKLAGRRRDAATYYLELALAPNQGDSSGPGLIQPHVINYGELRGFDLSQYDCVFLCNVSSFDEAEVQLLESYLRSGGGVIWSLGDRVQIENYNRILYRDGNGILPAKLEKVISSGEEPQQAFGFDALEYQHPLLKAFQGNADSGLERTQTFQYIRTQVSPEKPVRVALNFSSGDPAILERRVGSGKAVLITTSLDQTWGNWALWPSYVPVVQELVQWTVRGTAGDRLVEVNEPLQRTLQTRGAETTATVLRPDSVSEPARSSRQGNLTEFTYDRTDLSGWYEMQFGPPVSRQEGFAVHVDMRESQVDRLERDELEEELLAGVKFQYHTDWQDLEEASTTATAEWTGFSRLLLLIVFYLLFAEMLLAWDFSAGLWLLCPPLAAWRWWRRSV